MTAPREKSRHELQVSSAYTVADQLRMTKATRYFAWQAELAAEALGQRVLEVGCGLGNFTEHLRDRQAVTGIDTDGACVARHRERFADCANVRALELDALDPALLDLRAQKFDSIACLNVLEHIEEDTLLLSRFRQLLPPGGRVVLLIPAFMALYGPIDERLGHYRRYTRQSLAARAHAAGLGVRTLRFMNVAGFFGWWANAKVLRRTEQSEDQIAVFDRWIVPVQRRLERLVPPPLGQSLFAVLEKH